MTTWLIALSLVGMVAVGGYWWSSLRPQRIPDEWPLSPRLILNSRERAVYELLLRTFPHMTIFVKLPLTRFLQLRDAKSAEYWYNLISPLQVSFVLCTRETRIAAVVDLVFSGKQSEAAMTMKSRALAAAEIKFVVLSAEPIPTANQLRMAVLGEKPEALPNSTLSTGTHRVDFDMTRQRLEQIIQDKRETRDVWNRDSVINKDSFIMPDSRRDPDLAVPAPPTAPVTNRQSEPDLVL
jgi:hypothetical protein